MSIAGISSSTNLYQDPMSQIQSLREDFSGLTASLTSGDLSGVRTAFTTLIQDLGISGAQSGQQTGAASQLSTDLAAVGTTLNSGNLSDAQKAFATLMQHLKAGGLHRHHHHHHSGSAQNMAGTLGTDLAAVGSALQSNDLAGAQNAFATLMQDIGSNGAQSTTVTSSTNAQSAANGQGNPTASLLDKLQTTNGTSQNGSGSSVTTLFQALSLYAAQVGRFSLNLPTTGLFSAIG